MPTYELDYFAAPGRAEAIRVTFALGGIDYTDTRNTGAEFGAKRAAGKYPFNMVPVLTIDGRASYGESMAIQRYVAKMGGLYPADPLAALEADQYADHAMDIRGRVSAVKYGPASAKKAGLAKLREDIPPRVERLLAKALDDGKMFHGGARPAFADANIYSLALALEDMGLLSLCPRLGKYKDDFEAVPAIAAHVKRVAALPKPAPAAPAAGGGVTDQQKYLALGVGAAIVGVALFLARRS